MVEFIAVGISYLLVAGLSFAAGIYLAKKDVIETEKIKLPELPPLKSKPKGAILGQIKPLNESEQELEV